MTQLTTHFALEEFINSSTALRLGIDNTPPQDVIDNLTVTANGLEQVRDILGIVNSAINIDSGYRCPALNAAVHGVATSAHVTGYAADFVCPGYGTPLDIVKAIATSDLKFYQLIQEVNWVHISFDPKMRMQIMTATFVNGKASYQNGLG